MLNSRVVVMLDNFSFPIIIATIFAFIAAFEIIQCTTKEKIKRNVSQRYNNIRRGRKESKHERVLTHHCWF